MHLHLSEQVQADVATLLLRAVLVPCHTVRWLYTRESDVTEHIVVDVGKGVRQSFASASGW